MFVPVIHSLCLPSNLPLPNLTCIRKADYEERRLREASKQEHLQYLRDQIAEQAKIKEEWKKTKNGSIEAGFYSGFGNNCR